MTSAFDSFDQSPNGGFYQSALGVRGLASDAEGETTAKSLLVWTANKHPLLTLNYLPLESWMRDRCAAMVVSSADLDAITLTNHYAIYTGMNTGTLTTAEKAALASFKSSGGWVIGIHSGNANTDGTSENELFSEMGSSIELTDVGPSNSLPFTVSNLFSVTSVNFTGGSNSKVTGGTTLVEDGSGDIIAQYDSANQCIALGTNVAAGGTLGSPTFVDNHDFFRGLLRLITGENRLDSACPDDADHLHTADNVTVVFNAALTITNVGPTSGPEAGGTTVFVGGTGFTASTTVDFGASAATGVTNFGSTLIQCTSPAGTGTVDVTVTDGGDSDTLSSAYTYT